jgi:hypothetical protein
MLTEQLGGQLRLDTSEGTGFLVDFPKQPEPR